MRSSTFFRHANAPYVVLLTYSFDPIYFERTILPDLESSDARRILIIADRREIENSLPRWAEHVRHLGQRYELCPATCDGSFHPKVMLRIGPTGGMVWNGSGNITFGGQGGNQEVAACWPVGPEHADRGIWIAAFCRDLTKYVASDSARLQLEQMAEAPWLPADATLDRKRFAPLLLSRPDQALADQIADRLRPRRFDRATIFTGSTDDKGACLRWLTDQFGISAFEVIVSPEFCDFAREQMGPFESALRLRKPEVSRRLHAKLYVLEGPAGPVLIFGSANCSAAAWRVPVAHGGNVEAVSILENVPEDARNSLLKGRIGDEFELPASRPAQVVDGELESEGQRFGIQTALVQHGQLSLRLAGVVDPSATAVAQLFERPEAAPIARITMTSRDGAVWLGTIPDAARDWPLRYVHFKAEKVDRIVVDSWHWITSRNDLDRFAARSRSDANVPTIFSGADTAYTSPVAKAIHHLFDQYYQGAPWRPPGGKTDGHQRTPKAPPPCDPVALLRSMHSPEFVHSNVDGVAVRSATGIDAIMGRLFSYDTDGHSVDAIQTSDSLQDANDQTKRKDKKRRQRRPAPAAGTDLKLLAALPNRIRERLVQLEDWDRLRLLPPEHLVAGICFTAGLIYKACQEAWIDPDTSRSLLVALIDHLVRQRHTGHEAQGMLASLEHAAYSEGVGEYFASILHDGRAWMTLLTTVSLIDCWEGPLGRFEKALAVHDVMKSPALVPQDTEGNRARIQQLYWHLDEEEQDALAHAALEIGDRLPVLTSRLEQAWASRKGTSQLRRRCATKCGDLMWHPVAGWGWALTDATPDHAHLEVHLHRKGHRTVVANGFYLNVTQESDRDSTLAALLDAVAAPASDIGLTGQQ